MKKFFTFLMMAMLFTTAFAEEKTLTVSMSDYVATNNCTVSAGQEVTVYSSLALNDDITLSVNESGNNGSFWGTSPSIQWRLYQNQGAVAKLTAAQGCTIVSATFTYSITNTGTLTFKGNQLKSTAVAEINSTEAEFPVGNTGTDTKGQVRITAVTVVYTTGSTPAVTVATPVISGTTPFDDETEVSISCKTTGASIYYTLDGSTPSNQSTQYTGAFDINATTTVKAIAYKDNTASSVASKVFTMNPKKVNVGTVDALNKLADDTEFTYISDVVVTGQTGLYLYVQDETAATLVYGQVGQTYKFGDVIPAGWTGKKVTFKGAPEMTNLAGFQASFFTNEVPVKEFDTKTAASLENFSQYGVIKNVTIDLAGKKLVAEDYTEIAYYDRFKATFPEVVEGKKFNVNVIVGWYNGPQVFPVAFEEVVEPEAPKYSLVGYINGAEYGYESDYETPGQYVFNEEGKLTVSFNETSYVFVKLTDNSKWFLSQTFVPQAEAFIGETATTTATMVNGADYGEKMQVPAGEVEITLTVTDENTVVLTYSLPGTKDPEEEAVYYVAGDFNNWNAADEAFEMTKNDNGIYELQFTVDGDETGYEFKVTDGTWNHSWPTSNYAFDAAEPSDVLITFNPETKEITVTVTPHKGTGVNDITVAGAKAYKTIENGEVIIVKDGVKYNIMGQKK